jgi:hypothetical protein
LRLVIEDKVVEHKPDACEEQQHNPDNIQSAPKSGKKSFLAIPVENEKSNDNAEHKTTKSCKK